MDLFTSQEKQSLVFPDCWTGTLHVYGVQIKSSVVGEESNTLDAPPPLPYGLSAGLGFGREEGVKWKGTGWSENGKTERQPQYPSDAE